MGRRGTDQQFLVNSWVQRKSAGSWAHLSQGLGFLALLYCVSQRTDPAGSLPGSTVSWLSAGFGQREIGG